MRFNNDEQISDWLLFCKPDFNTKTIQHFNHSTLLHCYTLTI